MRTSPTLRRALLPALLASALPLGISAQSVALSFAGPLREDPLRAEELHAQAMALTDGIQGLTSARARRISDLHVRAAELFGLDDPRGITCLKHAANLVHRHDPARGAKLHEMAADRALASGDVLQAAHAYVDVAAFVNQSIAEGGLSGEEWGPGIEVLAERARLLASSPLLAETDRAAILARIR